MGTTQGEEGGFHANVPRLPQMHFKRDCEATLGRALKEEYNCASAFLSPVCITGRICRLCRRAREATSIQSL